MGPYPWLVFGKIKKLDHIFAADMSHSILYKNAIEYPGDEVQGEAKLENSDDVDQVEPKKSKSKARGKAKKSPATRSRPSASETMVVHVSDPSGVWVKKTWPLDVVTMMDSVLARVPAQKWNTECIMTIFKAVWTLALDGSVTFRGQFFKQWSKLRRSAKDYLAVVHDMVATAEDADRCDAGSDDEHVSIKKEIEVEPDDDCHALVAMSKSNFTLIVSSFLQSNKEAAPVRDSRVFQKVAASIAALSMKSQAITFKLLLHDTFDIHALALSNETSSLLCALPKYWGIHKKMLASCTGLIDGLSTLEHMLQFRTKLVLALVEDSKKDLGLMDAHLDILNSKYLDDLASVDSRLHEKESWVRTWMWLLAETSPEIIEEELEKRMDAVTSFLTMANDVNDVAPQSMSLEPSNKAAEKDGNETPMAGPPAKRSRVAPPPVSKDVPLPAWLGMFDVEYTDHDGSVKSVPMRTLDSCATFVYAELLKAILHYYHQSDSGYSTITLLGVKDANGQVTKKVQGIKCQVVNKSMRMNMMGPVGYVPKQGSICIGEAFGVRLYCSPWTDHQAGSFLPGWYVERSLKPEGCNCLVHGHEVNVEFPLQMIFFTKKEVHHIKLTIYHIKPKPDIIGNKKVILKRQWMNASLEMRTTPKDRILETQKVNMWPPHSLGTSRSSNSSIFLVASPHLRHLSCVEFT